MKLVKAATAALPGLLLAAPILAEDAADYPTKSIRMIVPLAAGNQSHTVARMFADRMPKELGQTVSVENKPGSDAMIFRRWSALRIAPIMHDAPYDPVKYFDLIADTASNAYVLVTCKDFPFNSVTDVINAANANRGKITYATDSLV